MVQTEDASGYGAMNPPRRAGPSEAARRGAVAYLVRSLATGESRAPHTGALNYQADAPKIPAAALSVVDAELLERMAAHGEPVRIRLRLASTSGPATAWNVVGDIPGTGSEMIVVGGHLDSWDPGQGAIDDGAGMAITVAAARLAGAQARPARTLRVVLYGAEEPEFSQLASEAYAAAHGAEAPRVAAVGESDAGADRVWSLQLPSGALAKPEMKTLAAVLAPLAINVSPQAAAGSGSDTEAMVKLGAPPVSFRQDASRYFDWHHSAEDTLDKVDRAQLNQNVAAWAALLYIVANSAVDLHPAPAAAAAPAR
ncbi:MAG TPA: M28 family peptidase, partial [Caulobacteraceae bacterium]|nr:M28 family peptidase [Caulobacteraceae bacterium]